MVGNWEVARWVSSVPYPYGEADARQWIDLVARDHATARPRRFAIALKDSDRLLGCIALTSEAADGSAEAELGYWLGQPYWGNRYAPEAAAAIVAYGFCTPGLRTIRAHTDPANTRSQAVLRRCGFRHVGEIDLPQPTRNGARGVPLFRRERVEPDGDTGNDAERSGR